jgi:hypothetical protein
LIEPIEAYFVRTVQSETRPNSSRQHDGSETGFGDDLAGVMGAYSRSGVELIDIIATQE